MTSEFSPVHFFKIIVTESLDQGKLMIPIKFVNKYGECLPTAICLKTPNGSDWKINLVKSDGKIWFEKGWKEFTNYHSLSHGHLLVFKYERTSHFEVRIFDKSALEITYPFKKVEANNEEDCRTSQKRKSYSSFEIGSGSCVKKRQGKKVNTTLEIAKEFKTCNPSFIVVMGASYVEHHFRLVSNYEKVWHVKYRIRMSPTRLRFDLVGGWRKFSGDNNLKVGDVCNFELILKTNMTFQVHIFRKTNEVNTDCSTFANSSQMKRKAAHGDVFIISNIQEVICILKQGYCSISSYYTKLKMLWQELDNFRPIPTCDFDISCLAMDKIRSYKDSDQVIRFLKGLNDQYSVVRSQIILMDLLPNIRKFYSLLVQQERQIFTPIDEYKLLAFYTGQSQGRGYSSHGRYGRIGRSFNGRGRGNQVCVYCEIW